MLSSYDRLITERFSHVMGIVQRRRKYLYSNREKEPEMCRANELNGGILSFFVDLFCVLIVECVVGVEYVLIVNDQWWNVYVTCPGSLIRA